MSLSYDVCFLGDSSKVQVQKMDRMEEGKFFLIEVNMFIFFWKTYTH